MSSPSGSAGPASSGGGNAGIGTGNAASVGLGIGGAAGPSHSGDILQNPSIGSTTFNFNAPGGFLRSLGQTGKTVVIVVAMAMTAGGAYWYWKNRKKA